MRRSFGDHQFPTFLTKFGDQGINRHCGFGCCREPTFFSRVSQVYNPSIKKFRVIKDQPGIFPFLHVGAFLQQHPVCCDYRAKSLFKQLYVEPRAGSLIYMSCHPLKLLIYFWGLAITNRQNEGYLQERVWNDLNGQVIGLRD